MSSKLGASLGLALLIMAAGCSGDDPARRERIKSGEEDPPAWLLGLGEMLDWFAPRIRRFAPPPGARTAPPNVTEIAVGMPVERLLGQENRDSRIATFTLVSGRLARIAFTCRPLPNKACEEPNPAVLCLVAGADVARPDSCPPGRARREGSVLVGPGGGRIVAEAGSEAAIVRLKD